MHQIPNDLGVHLKSNMLLFIRGNRNLADVVLTHATAKFADSTPHHRDCSTPCKFT